MRIGLISDTHGLLRTEALAAMHGSDAIVHAGDIGGPAILDALSAIAPVTAVRGNNDHGDWAAALPMTARLKAGDVMVHVLHDLKLLDIDLRAEGVQVVVAGHSHQPSVEWRSGATRFSMSTLAAPARGASGCPSRWVNCESTVMRSGRTALRSTWRPVGVA